MHQRVQNQDNQDKVRQCREHRKHNLTIYIMCGTNDTRGKYDTLLRYEGNAAVPLPHVTTWVFSLQSLSFLLFFFKFKSLCIPIYLSHSSTLNVGVVVVMGVGGELCLLTRWFKDVSCTLSRLPRNALLWLANFSLFMGEPKITSSHDASPHITHNRTFYITNPFSGGERLSVGVLAGRKGGGDFWRENIRV